MTTSAAGRGARPAPAINLVPLALSPALQVLLCLACCCWGALCAPTCQAHTRCVASDDHRHAMVSRCLVCQHVHLSNHRIADFFQLPVLSVTCRFCESRAGGQEVHALQQTGPVPACRGTPKLRSLPRCTPFTPIQVSDDLESDGAQLHAEVVFTTRVSSRETCAPAVKSHTLLICFSALSAYRAAHVRVRCVCWLDSHGVRHCTYREGQQGPDQVHGWPWISARRGAIPGAVPARCCRRMHLILSACIVCMNPAIIVGHPPQCCSPQHVTQLCQLHELCMATGACSRAHTCAYSNLVVNVSLVPWKAIQLAIHLGCCLVEQARVGCIHMYMR